MYICMYIDSISRIWYHVIPYDPMIIGTPIPCHLIVTSTYVHTHIYTHTYMYIYI